MGTTRASKVKLLTAIGLLTSSAALRQEPEEVDLFAKQRILTAIGPGLRAVRQGANGRLYVLASAAPGLVVVDGERRRNSQLDYFRRGLRRGCRGRDLRG